MLNTDGMTIEAAIVAQACEDYRHAIRGKCQYPEHMLAEVMQFFNSEWYKRLTNIDSKKLIAMLDEEWANGQILIKAGNEVECPELKTKYHFICPICGGDADVHEFTRKHPKTKVTRYYRSYKCNDCHNAESAVPKAEKALKELAHEND